MTETETIKKTESSTKPSVAGEASEILAIKYQMESLALEDDSAQLELPFPSVVEVAHDDGGHEIEMLRKTQAGLPEPIVEPGPELMSGLEAIPDKMAFKIGEAAEMVGVKQYVLRYWESEFEMLRPRKSKNNQRVYSRRDVETAMMIKKLLYEDRFSIEGARAALRHLKNQVKEDRGIKRMVETHETAVSKTLAQLGHLVADIRRLRELFSA